MKKIFFLADHFYPEYVGGAEMALEACIEQCPCEAVKVATQTLTEDFIRKEMAGNFVVVSNFAEIDNFALLKVIQECCKYIVIEYDFKMCPSRNPTVHEYRSSKKVEKVIPHIKDFFEGALHVFFMSQKQMDWIKEHSLVKGEVLSSTFSKAEISKIREFMNKPACARSGFVVTYSEHIVKGTREAVRYSHSKALDYKLLYDKTHEEMLEEFRKAEGYVFLPLGEDTCPRTVIEAKLMGCKIIVNSNVLHHDEAWFDKDNNEEILSYLDGRVPFFWSRVNEITSNMDNASRGASRQCVGV